jgi:hypothetical protein
MNNCGSSRPAWMKHKKLKTGEKLHRLHDRGRRTFHCGRDMFRDMFRGTDRSGFCTTARQRRSVCVDLWSVSVAFLSVFVGYSHWVIGPSVGRRRGCRRAMVARIFFRRAALSRACGAQRGCCLRRALPRTSENLRSRPIVLTRCWLILKADRWEPRLRRKNWTRAAQWIESAGSCESSLPTPADSVPA